MKLRLRKELSKKEKWRIVMSYFREHPKLMMEVMPPQQNTDRKEPIIDGNIELKEQEEFNEEYFVGVASKKMVIW